MKTCRIFMMIVMVAFLVSLTGCCGGGTETVVVEKQTTVPRASVGDELLKLQEAKEKGALTDEEFEGAKKKILEAK